MKKDIKLLIDKYELTMNEVYIQKGETKEMSYYDAFFRKIPFNGGYAVLAGLDSIIEYIKDFRFDKSDIDYIRELGTFSEEHIKYLENFKFRGDLYAIPDGTPVFGNEPLLTIRANKIEANLLETIILAYFNEQIKFATGAKRVVEAASGRPVMEFGARRADGPYAAVDAAKCAVMAGCVGTSNMQAGKDYGVPVLGTMAHSYIQDADSEYEAFLDYARVFPEDSIFLVDTYDTLNSGIPNAIRVHKEFLEPNGYDLKAVRIDSGNLLELSIAARKIFDASGMHDTKIVASNGLDPKAIDGLIAAGAPIDILGVGDNIVAPKERVGVVYKLVGKEKEYGIIPRIKKSDDEFKTINPGYKRVYRLYSNETGLAIVDVIANFDEEIPEDDYILNVNGEEIIVKNYTVRELQVPIFRQGELVYQEPTLNEKRAYCAEQIERLPKEVRKLENAHTYPVALTPKVDTVKKALIAEINQNNENLVKRVI